MKYCISSRQSIEYLRKADEIKVAARDHEAITDLARRYPKADIILEWEGDGEVTLDELKTYAILAKGRLIVESKYLNLELDAFFSTNNIRYYWAYEFATPYELTSVRDLFHVCYIKVAAPLFFQMDTVAKYGVPVRVVANMANNGLFPQIDTTIGTWMRPEDTALYEPTVQAIEFANVNREQEQALFRIYAEQKAWPGKLSMIIQNLTTDCTNRMLPPDFTASRLNCGQRCTAGGGCRLCQHYFYLADPERLAYLVKENENESTNEHGTENS